MSNKQELEKEMGSYQDFRLEKDKENFSKAVAKMATDYVQFANSNPDYQKLNGSEKDNAFKNHLKFVKKVENKELKHLLSKGKTDKSLWLIEQQALKISYNAQDVQNDYINYKIGGSWIRTLQYKELNLAMQILSESKSETIAKQTMQSVFSAISDKSTQTLDLDYLNRCVDEAMNILQANGMEISRPKADIENE